MKIEGAKNKTLHQYHVILNWQYVCLYFRSDNDSHEIKIINVKGY